jgi:hypothetical protein
VALLCDSADVGVLALIEQAEVKLSAEPDVVVLDRANIQKVWREQALSLEQAAIGATTVMIGKVLTADILVVVSLRENCLAWRVMNTADGRLLRLSVPQWPPENRETTLAQAVTSIKGGIAKARAVAAAPQYIAVARFVNQDVSRQYDSLEGVLPELVSAFLADEPRVIVVERADLPKIEAELMQTAGIGGAYRASTLLVEGMFTTKRADGSVTVAADLSAGTPGTPGAIRYACEGSALDAPGLARAIAERLLRELGDSSRPTANPGLADEANVFFSKGRFFDSQKAYAASVPLYETACALAPTNSLYRLALGESRRCALKSSSLAPGIRLTYCIQEAADCQRAFQEDLPSTAYMRRVAYLTGEFPWLHATYIDTVPFASPDGARKRDAVDAYFTALHAVVAWHKARKQPLPKDIALSLSCAIIEGRMLETPASFRMALHQLVDLRVAGNEAEALYSFDLMRLSYHHIKVMEGVPVDAFDRLLDDTLDELTRDGRPLVRLLATVALSAKYRPRQEGADSISRPDANERLQSAVRQLVVWSGPAVPESVYRDLHGGLADCRDPRPFAAIIRAALDTPGANRSAVEQTARRVIAALTTRGFTMQDSPSTRMTPESRACVDDITQCLTNNGLTLPAPPKPLAANRPAPTALASNTVPAHRVAWHVDVGKLVGREISASRAALAVGEQVAYLIVFNGSRLEHELTVNAIDLQTGNVQTNVAVWRMPLDPPYRDGTISVSLQGAMLWVQGDGQSFLYAPGKGIRPIAPEDGFPAGAMKSWAAVGGRHFVGCTGGFGEWFPAQRRFEMICSSRTPDARLPLAGGLLYEVMGIAADETNQKVILAVMEISNRKDTRNGLWEYCVTNGAQRQLVPFLDSSTASIYTFRSDAEYVYLRPGGMPFVLAYNYRSPAQSTLITTKEWPHEVREVVPTQDIRYEPGHFVLAWPIAAKNGTLIYAKGLSGAAGLFVWPRNAAADHPIRLVDKEGREVASQKYKSDRIKELAACRYGIVYRFGGCVGLITDLGGGAD